MSPWLDFYRQIIAYFSPIPAEKISGHRAKTPPIKIILYISFLENIKPRQEILSAY